MKEYDSIRQTGLVELMRYQTNAIMTCIIIQLYKPAIIVRVLLNKIYIVHEQASRKLACQTSTQKISGLLTYSFASTEDD